MYKVIRDQKLDELVKRVNEAIELSNYEPIGGIAIVHVGLGQYYFFQAMYKKVQS